MLSLAAVHRQVIDTHLPTAGQSGPLRTYTAQRCVKAWTASRVPSSDMTASSGRSTIGVNTPW